MILMKENNKNYCWQSLKTKDEVTILDRKNYIPKKKRKEKVNRKT